MSPELIKLIDRLAGSILLILLGRTHEKQETAVQSILIIRPGGIGDAVLLSPAITALKATNPHIQITILAERRNCQVFRLTPAVDEVLCYDRLEEFIKALTGKFDVVIDTEQWYRLSAIVARLVRAPVKIGFDTNERRRMFTHRIKYDLNAFETGNFNALLEPLGVEPLQIPKILAVPDDVAANATQLLQTFPSEKIVTIFPGSSVAEKRWAAEHFIHVARCLEKEGYGVVVVGGAEDRADGHIIAGIKGLNLAGKTTLAETAAVIARSSLLISGDSGVLHIAAGLGIPTVSLFGPSSVTKWAPQGEKHVVLHKDLPCSPCSKFGTIPPCPYGIRCMKEITADQVMEAAVQLLQKEK